MTSINGLRQISATSIQNSGEIYLGNDIDVGTAGQALVSGGPNEPARWDTHTGVVQPLTAGTHITFSSGNPTFDGSIPDTINSTPGGGLIGGDGIDISGATISTDNDNTTISNSTGENRVLKVPNDLTISQNGTIIDTFNGSSAKTIDLEGKYIAGDGIDISGHPVPHIEADTDEITISHNVGGAEKLQVLKVPNALTAGTNINFSSGTTYDGSSAITISATDTDTQLALVADPGIVITSTGGLNRTIGARVDGTTIGFSGNDLTTIKVPNTLTITDSAGSSVVFDGSSAQSITINDNQLNLTAGANIVITSSGGLNRTIAVNDDITNQDTITMTSTAGSTAITGNNYPSNPTTCTYLDLSSSTNVFPNFVGGSEILKSMSFIDNTSQNRIIIYNTANKFIFDGSTHLNGNDQLEIDFTATSTTGYCEFGFYANSGTSGMIFYIGIAAATGGTSPFSTTLGSGAVSIDAYKLGLLDGSTSYYSLRELLDFTGFENTYLTSKFYFNNLSVGTRYRMALYGRCYNSGNIYIHSGGRSTTGLATGGRVYFQPAFMKFYEYDSSIGGARTTGSGGGGGM